MEMESQELGHTSSLKSKINLKLGAEAEPVLLSRTSLSMVGAALAYHNIKTKLGENEQEERRHARLGSATRYQLASVNTPSCSQAFFFHPESADWESADFNCNCGHRMRNWRKAPLPQKTTSTPSQIPREFVDENARVCP